MLDTVVWFLSHCSKTRPKCTNKQYTSQPLCSQDFGWCLKSKSFINHTAFNRLNTKLVQYLDPRSCFVATAEKWEIGKFKFELFLSVTETNCELWMHSQNLVYFKAGLYSVTVTLRSRSETLFNVQEIGWAGILGGKIHLRKCWCTFALAVRWFTEIVQGVGEGVKDEWIFQRVFQKEPPKRRWKNCLKRHQKTWKDCQEQTNTSWS